MTVDKHSEISGELEFAALHADDLLLDALGARGPLAASGGTTDVVAGLLQAYVQELDSRPGPLTGLLVVDDEFVPVSHPAPAMVAAPPLVESLAESLAEPIALSSHRRLRFGAGHRAAAIATVGALVLGLGGVSAAVTGQGGPIQGIRHVVGSVTDQVSPQRSEQDRISRTLAQAEKALNVNDLRGARDLLEKARTAIEGQSDQTAFSALRTNLIELRDRWHRAFDEAATPSTATPGQDAGTIDPSVPGQTVLSPQGKAGGLVDGTTDGADDNTPTQGLPVGPKSGITQTKDQIADHAEQKLEPLPDLPVGEMRAPTWAPIIGDGSLLGGK
ncbi:MAG TPA: hypothetical protein VNC22_07560 [Sporichthya sp.]|nr:hypothetical protein [Sporichthya sp.]